ncbi:MAG: hypothetical protein ACOH5I_22525 [Oligoflexus sp.]
MNDNQNDPNSNIAFNTNPDTQASTNPFTGDLKGEFSSDFGTNTNAVSQIFKSSGFSAENRTKYIAIGMLMLLALAGVAYYLTSGESSDPFADDFATDEFSDPLMEDEFADDLMGESPAPADGMGAMDQPMDAAPMDAAPMDSAMPGSASMMGATGSIVLMTPENGARQTYDETTGPAEFSWEGPADRIIFSRSSTMNPVTMSITLSGASSFALDNPYPGTWYWQVENTSGLSEVRSFRILSPEPRSFPVTQPTPGGALAGNGGAVTWQAGDKIARYAVEIVGAGQSFANPQYRFGTSGTSVSLNGVAPGSYDFRIGAFSEVAGRWEWQIVRNVTVQ